MIFRNAARQVISAYKQLPWILQLAISSVFIFLIINELSHYFYEPRHLYITSSNSKYPIPVPITTKGFPFSFSSSPEVDISIRGEPFISERTYDIVNGHNFYINYVVILFFLAIKNWLYRMTINAIRAAKRLISIYKRQPWILRLITSSVLIFLYINELSYHFYERQYINIKYPKELLPGEVFSKGFPFPYTVVMNSPSGSIIYEVANGHNFYINYVITLIFLTMMGRLYRLVGNAIRAIRSKQTRP